jgi:hypothetical protein
MCLNETYSMPTLHKSHSFHIQNDLKPDHLFSMIFHFAEQYVIMKVQENW